ncbi:MAG: hypothetical protein AAFO93_14990 [Pseudomonadota bacterium]
MLRYLTLIATITFVLSPLVTSPFSGFEADQLPVPQVDPPIQPAGWAFSIWGVIYLWLLVSAVYGVLRPTPHWDAARAPLLVSLAIGTPWLAIANASVLWATVTIWLMLGTAILALLRSPVEDRYWFRLPVGLYAGWLSAAAFVSLASLAAGNGILDGVIWAWIGIPAAVALGIVVQTRATQAATYGAAIAWALVAIMVVNLNDLVGIAALAGIGSAVMAIMAVRSMKI